MVLVASISHLPNLSESSGMKIYIFYRVVNQVKQFQDQWSHTFHSGSLGELSVGVPVFFSRIYFHSMTGKKDIFCGFKFLPTKKRIPGIFEQLPYNNCL